MPFGLSWAERRLAIISRSGPARCAWLRVRSWNESGIYARRRVKHMCGIAGAFDLEGRRLRSLDHTLSVMNDLQRHRGPDGVAAWSHPRGHVGLAHRRLSIIDLVSGAQPMTDGHGNWLTFNGEIYNYIELRQE